MSEVQLTADGERALGEAEKLCRATNVAIQAPEHLLGAALLVSAERGVKELPNRASVMKGLAHIPGRGDSPVTEKVMPGSGVRMALNATAGALAAAGETRLSAAVIARGFIASDEINPMFYAAIGTTREALLKALERAE